MIRYTDTLVRITPDQLRGGFFVGWPNPPSPETHLRLLAGSAAVILAIDDATGMKTLDRKRVLGVHSQKDH